VTAYAPGTGYTRICVCECTCPSAHYVLFFSCTHLNTHSLKDATPKSGSRTPVDGAPAPTPHTPPPGPPALTPPALCVELLRVLDQQNLKFSTVTAIVERLPLALSLLPEVSESVYVRVCVCACICA
jgi:hypothetical protein